MQAPALHVCPSRHTLHMLPPSPHDCVDDAETISETHAPFDTHPLQAGGGALHAEPRATTARNNAARREGAMETRSMRKRLPQPLTSSPKCSAINTAVSVDTRVFFTLLREGSRKTPVAPLKSVAVSVHP